MLVGKVNKENFPTLISTMVMPLSRALNPKISSCEATQCPAVEIGNFHVWMFGIMFMWLGGSCKRETASPERAFPEKNKRWKKKHLTRFNMTKRSTVMCQNNGKMLQRSVVVSKDGWWHITTSSHCIKIRPKARDIGSTVSNIYNCLPICLPMFNSTFMASTN